MPRSETLYNKNFEKVEKLRKILVDGESSIFMGHIIIEKMAPLTKRPKTRHDLRQSRWQSSTEFRKTVLESIQKCRDLESPKR